MRLHGRLVEADRTGGTLAVEGGARSWQCRWPAGIAPLGPGDFVEVEGVVEDDGVRVERIAVLAPAVEQPAGGWSAWHQEQGRLRGSLELRAKVLAAVRGYFAGAGFLEVETPALVAAPGQEAHLQLFETSYLGRAPQDCFLVSSPEHHMKRLLGAGFERIFQLARAYRNGERTSSHNPEFCMLEWYRAYASYEEIMVDTEELVAGAARAACGSTVVSYLGVPLNLEPPWPRMTVREAFGAFAGIDLDFEANPEEFWRQASGVCGSVDTTDTWEEIFFKVLLEKIEPGMAATGRPVLLKDYPASMAALAKVRPCCGVAERVEAYVGGLELANGFTELNDPVEQRRRFTVERHKRAALGYPVYPLDEEFLRMLELGMPPAGGMALGVDRLVMLLADAAHIDEVIAFPFGVAEGLV